MGARVAGRRQRTTGDAYQLKARHRNTRWAAGEAVARRARAAAHRSTRTVSLAAVTAVLLALVWNSRSGAKGGEASALVIESRSELVGRGGVTVPASCTPTSSSEELS